VSASSDNTNNCEHIFPQQAEGAQSGFLFSLACFSICMLLLSFFSLAYLGVELAFIALR
jgi:hypothetical protein